MTTTEHLTPEPGAPALLRDAAEAAPPRQRSLSRGRITVELENGDTFEVEVDNRDYVGWDLAAARHKWPAGSDAPFLFQTFLAFSAASRAGLWAGRFDGPGGFQSVCLLASMHAPDEDDAARPTR